MASAPTWSTAGCAAGGSAPARRWRAACGGCGRSCGRNARGGSGARGAGGSGRGLRPSTRRLRSSARLARWPMEQQRRPTIRSRRVRTAAGVRGWRPAGIPRSAPAGGAAPATRRLSAQASARASRWLAMSRLARGATGTTAIVATTTEAKMTTGATAILIVATATGVMMATRATRGAAAMTVAAATRATAADAKEPRPGLRLVLCIARPPRAARRVAHV